MNNFISIVIDSFDPESVVQDHCAKLLKSQVMAQILLVNYPFTQYWLQSESKQDSTLSQTMEISLTAVYFLSRVKNKIYIKVAVSDDFETISSALQQSTDSISEENFDRFCAQYLLPSFSSKQLLKLNPVSIAKPWGREIWYTGIEQRGVAMATADGRDTPLPWILSALPGELCDHQQKSLILLKILDPYADKDTGDLYFELHQKKREVYVVTSIDEQSWPDGKGAIRFGFDQEKRKQYAGDDDFKAAFLTAVKSYESIRRKIDRKKDQWALVSGGNAADTASPLLNDIPTSWIAEESTLRQQMEAFTGQITLTVGDVVKVPCLTPHSLQHGVRTIEFQTPVYERLIISFNQKVETQGHWDSEAAAALMNLDNVEQEPSVSLVSQPGLEVERIVEFDDFNVLRVKQCTNVEFVLEGIESYCLLMAIQGEISVWGDKLLAEEAALLAKAANGAKIGVQEGKSACFLLAYPK